MRMYHQCGHNSKWNADSLVEDGAGDGLIVSPVNLRSDKVKELDQDLRRRSIFDPQYYLIGHLKGKLDTYDYVPAVLKNDVSTRDYHEIAVESAQQCVRSEEHTSELQSR